MYPYDTVNFIETVIRIAGLYVILLMILAFLRKTLWLLSSIFQIIDEIMWFLYNPLRGTMKIDYHQKYRTRYNRIYTFLNVIPIMPLYKLFIYFMTTPLRVVNAIYFDFLMYLLVSSSDTIEELIHPKLNKMRYKSGFGYVWRWVIFLPYRVFWFTAQNCTHVIDAICMVVVSIAWPTFTMFHGSSQSAVSDISRKGRWYVGSGNFGGSGIYFARSVKTAMHYASGQSYFDEKGQEKFPIIIARVTLSVLRNCSTLPTKTRHKFGEMGHAGKELAQDIRFPFYATELWREDKRWWEYCILFGGKDGEFVSSWRIRPIRICPCYRKRETFRIITKIMGWTVSLLFKISEYCHVLCLFWNNLLGSVKYILGE